jgi:hypothetical protein
VVFEEVTLVELRYRLGVTSLSSRGPSNKSVLKTVGAFQAWALAQTTTTDITKRRGPVASPGVLSPPRGDRLLGSGDAGEIGAVRGGIVVLR